MTQGHDRERLRRNLLNITVLWKQSRMSRAVGVAAVPLECCLLVDPRTCIGIVCCGPPILPPAARSEKRSVRSRFRGIAPAVWPPVLSTREVAVRVPPASRRQPQLVGQSHRRSDFAGALDQP